MVLVLRLVPPRPKPSTRNKSGTLKLESSITARAISASLRVGKPATCPQQSLQCMGKAEKTPPHNVPHKLPPARTAKQLLKPRPAAFLSGCAALTPGSVRSGAHLAQSSAVDMARTQRGVEATTLTERGLSEASARMRDESMNSSTSGLLIPSFFILHSASLTLQGAPSKQHRVPASRSRAAALRARHRTASALARPDDKDRSSELRTAFRSSNTSRGNLIQTWREF